MAARPCGCARDTSRIRAREADNRIGNLCRCTGYQFIVESIGAGRKGSPRDSSQRIVIARPSGRPQRCENLPRETPQDPFRIRPDRREEEDVHTPLGQSTDVALAALGIADDGETPREIVRQAKLIWEGGVPGRSRSLVLRGHILPKEP